MPAGQSLRGGSRLPLLTSITGQAGDSKNLFTSLWVLPHAHCRVKEIIPMAGRDSSTRHAKDPFGTNVMAGSHLFAVIPAHSSRPRKAPRGRTAFEQRAVLQGQ